MRVLLISLCSDPLSELEFVKPVEDILRKSGVKPLIKHCSKISLKDLNSVDKSIICGSALRDNAFLESRSFKMLEESDKPILSIGSGFHLIAKIFGCDLFNKTRIGVFKVRSINKNVLSERKYFYAYFMTKKAAKIIGPLKTLAKAGELECIVKHEHKDIYGCLFHPEVMNPEIILNFILKT
jgi:GMP synthase (glutamine-hydrolysing)